MRERPIPFGTIDSITVKEVNLALAGSSELEFLKEKRTKARANTPKKIDVILIVFINMLVKVKIL